MTCTCTVEDESSLSFTLWDGTAFSSQCPGSLDQIILVHSLFGLRISVECGNRISEIPPAPSNLNIPLDSLTRGRFSLTWTEPINVFGGVGSYQVMVRSDQLGDVTRLCGRIAAPNGEAAPLCRFTDWVMEG